MLIEEAKSLLNSLQQQALTFSDLLKSQEISVAKTQEHRSRFLQTTTEDINKQNYGSTSVLNDLDNSVNYLEDNSNNTQDKSIETVNSDTAYLGKLNDFCVNDTK